MSARLTLVAHASTAAIAAAAFPADEPLDARGAAAAAAAHGVLTRVGAALRSPARACAETATALGLAPVTTEPRLRDWDLGRWRGCTLDEAVAAEPAAVQEWLGAPDAAPHGGESLTALAARVANWLDTVPGTGHTVAVTHAGVVRAVLLAVLGAPAPAFWRIDVAPLTATVLRGGPGRWTLRSCGNPLGGGPADARRHPPSHP